MNIVGRSKIVDVPCTLIEGMQRRVRTKEEDGTQSDTRQR